MLSMTSEKHTPAERAIDGKKGGETAGKGSPGQEQWTSGLRQIYDQVVQEPLPDSFKDLLDQLDDKD